MLKVYYKIIVKLNLRVCLITLFFQSTLMEMLFLNVFLRKLLIRSSFDSDFKKTLLIFIILENFYYSSVRNIRNVF